MRVATDYLATMLKDLARAQEAFPAANWRDALSYGQLSSKIWMVDVLASVRPNLGRVEVHAGWLGILPWLMFFDERLTISEMVLYDLDPVACRAAEMLNEEQRFTGQFRAECRDIMTVQSSADTIINTSCDHIADLSHWRRQKTSFLALQSNNFHEADSTHVNTVSSLSGLIDQIEPSTIHYKGEKHFPKYTRFMLMCD